MMNWKILVGKLIVSAACVLAAGWWTTYFFEPTGELASRLLYLIPAILFGIGYFYDIARKRTSLLPPVLAKIAKLERRSLQETLGRLSHQERLELGGLFAGDGDGAQTRIRIYRKTGHASRWRIILRFTLINLAIILVLILVHAAGIWFFLPGKHEIKEIAQLVQLHLSKNQQGQIEFRGVVNDLYAPGEQMSPHLQKALVAREDRRFYEHWGLDVRGKIRAVLKSLGYILTFGQKGRLQGGSTITEQLAKNLFLSSDRGLLSGLRRKFKERILAFKLEAYYSKAEILEMYLNRVYFGRGAYGVETAARLYFNASPEKLRELDAYQSAILIQSLPAPSAYNCSKNRERAAGETRKLFDQMGMPLDEDRLAFAIERCHHNGKRTLIIPEHRYLRDWIIPQIKTSEFFDELEGDVTVVTTMNARMQRFAQSAIADTMQKYSNRFKGAQLPQAAVVALTPKGAVRAIMGGAGLY